MVQDEELGPVRQLVRHDVAGPDAQLQQAQRDPDRAAGELAVGDRLVGGDGGDPVRVRGGDRVQVVGDDPVGPPAFGGVTGGVLGGEGGLHGSAQLIVRPPLTLTVWPVT